MWRFGLSIVFCGMAMGLFALSAAADDQAAMTSYLKSPGLQQAVINAAAKSTVAMQNPCASPTYRVGNNVVVYKPMTFDGAGAPTAGAVKFPVKQEGCNADRILNVIIFVQPDRRVGTAALLPGTTHADPVLQKDAVSRAVAASGGQEPNCQVGYVGDTEFVSQDSAPVVTGAKGPPWKELWTLVSCTKRVQVPMQFIPDATGTTIAAGPKTAIKVLPIKAASH